MSDDFDYAAWLRNNPAPDLQEFIRAHGRWEGPFPLDFTAEDIEKVLLNGSFRHVAPEAWAEFDALKATWEAKRKGRFGRPHGSGRGFPRPRRSPLAGR